MRNCLIGFMLAFITSPLFAGISNVTATITDADSQTWNNGTFQVSFVPVQGTPISAYNVNGASFPLSATGSMNGAGVLTVALTDLSTITPLSGQWRFQLCPNASAGCQAVLTNAVVGGAPNLSAQLSANLLGPRFGGSNFSYGYLDIEVGTPAAPLFPGAEYFNVTSLVTREWTGSAWITIGGAGGTTINPTNGVIPFRLNATTFSDSPFTVAGGSSTSSGSITANGALNSSTFNGQTQNSQINSFFTATDTAAVTDTGIAQIGIVNPAAASAAQYFSYIGSLAIPAANSQNFSLSLVPFISEPTQSGSGNLTYAGTVGGLGAYFANPAHAGTGTIARMTSYNASNVISGGGAVTLDSAFLGVTGISNAASVVTNDSVYRAGASSITAGASMTHHWAFKADAGQTGGAGNPDGWAFFSDLADKSQFGPSSFPTGTSANNSVQLSGTPGLGFHFDGTSGIIFTQGATDDAEINSGTGLLLPTGNWVGWAPTATIAGASARATIAQPNGTLFLFGTAGNSSGSVRTAQYFTDTNCSAVGTAANPSVASCTAATAGSFSCATNASTGTCVVNTTAVTANSEIFITQRTDTTTGTRLGVTCNTTIDTVQRAVTAVTAATSFTINLGTIATNPECFSYYIEN